MTELPYLQVLFERLRNGYHLSPEDEPCFSAVAADYEAYAAYWAPLGLKLVRHPREFFYFAPDASEAMPDTLPRIAVFCFILVDHLANRGRPIEETFFGEHFLISRLPHFGSDRYTELLRQVDVHDIAGLKPVLRRMEKLGWLKFLGEEEFRFLRPVHRIFDKCIELSAAKDDPVVPRPSDIDGPPQ